MIHIHLSHVLDIYFLPCTYKLSAHCVLSLLTACFKQWFNCTCFYLCVLVYPFTVTDQCKYNNGGCSQLCLLTPSGRACTCSEGLILDDDGRTCKGMMNYDQGGMTFLVWNFKTKQLPPFPDSSRKQTQPSISGDLQSQ